MRIYSSNTFKKLRNNKRKTRLIFVPIKQTKLKYECASGRTKIVPKKMRISNRKLRLEKEHHVANFETPKTNAAEKLIR